MDGNTNESCPLCGLVRFDRDERVQWWIERGCTPDTAEQTVPAACECNPEDVEEYEEFEADHDEGVIDQDELWRQLGH